MLAPESWQMYISSVRNPVVKRLRALCRDSRFAKAEGVCVAEGAILLNGLPDKSIVRELYVRESQAGRIKIPDAAEPAVLSDRAFDSAADTKNPSGLIAVVERPRPGKIEGDTIGVLDRISDPGNLGNIVRTAAARGAKTVVCVGCADPFSPKAIRSAMTGTFCVGIVETDGANLAELLSGYAVVGLDMRGNCIYGYKRPRKVALVVGNEAHGISEETRKIVDEYVSLPTVRGESLNAATAFGIGLYLI